MYMRLDMQSEAIKLPDELAAALGGRAIKHLPRLGTRPHPRPGHISPLDSHVGPALLVILYELRYPDSFDDPTWKAALGTFKKAIDIAKNDKSIGGDEVLYGRAGLLWGMLNILKCVDQEMGEQLRWRDISAVVERATVEAVVTKLIETGEIGAKDYRHEHGEKDGILPLAWRWHEKYYLGA